MGLATSEPPDAPPAGRVERLRRRAFAEFEHVVERFPVVAALVEALERERAAGGVLLSGGLAYRLFFWLVPLGLLAATTIGLFSARDVDGLDTAARDSGLSAVAADAARQAIESSDQAQWYLLTFGLVLTVWTGFGVVRAMNIVYALAWGQPTPKVRLPPLAGTGFTVVAVVLSVTAAAVGEAVAWVGLGLLAQTVALVLAYAGAALGVSVFFPHGEAPPRALLPGAMLVSAGTMAIHAFVEIYLAPKLGRSTDVYGLLGASTVILLWLYLIARLITVSAFFNATVWARREPE